MLVEEAAELIERTLAPLSLDSFLDDVLDRRFCHVDADVHGARTNLLGADPAALLLGDFSRLSRDFGFHAEGATLPAPPKRLATSVKDFRALIGDFHDRGYTVRLDHVHPLSAPLAQFIRALEVHFMAPVGAHVFWSRGGGRAPIHHDERDMLIIQLVGSKAWTVSTKLSELPNTWAPQSNLPERLKHSANFVMKPGDLLYVPRGTPHSVQALEDTLHLSIGFSPPTLRDALIACADLASDLSRPLRESAGARAGAQALTGDFGAVPARVQDAVGVLARYCGSPGFVAEALRRRAARIVREMPAGAPPAQAEITTASFVQRRDLTPCQLSNHGGRLEIAFPGGRELVNAAMQPALDFIARSKAFHVRDLPGAYDDAVRVALVQKLVTDGLLEPASAPPVLG